MEFKEFIEKLNSDDKSTFEKYSKIRGVQQYRIIFEALTKVDSNVKFSDVNSFVILDKAIKDVLFKYLGTLEEYIRNDILLRFDFDPEAGPELILPTVDSQLIISVLNKGKASSTVVRTIKNDLEKLEEWADNVSESVEDSFDFPQEGFEYFAASLQENSPVSHELWACDNDGDLFSFEE